MTIEIATAVAIAKDVATGLAAIVAASVAVIGLRAWRRQLHGQTEYDLARRVLRAVYRVRDELQGVRSPLILASEFEAARRETGAPSSDKASPFTTDDEAAVYERRWKRLATALSDLQVEVIETEVIWGKSAVAQLKPLRQCVSDLNANLTLFFLHKRRQSDGYQTAPDVRERTEQIVWKVSDDPGQDQFSRRIEEAVAQIEDLVRPRLKL
jgi:hypothetical protein